ncbi:MAG: aspartate kinase [Acidaminococcales bacterium]|nr:aspartate kinase [Acidaminococcales bacterium]
MKIIVQKFGGTSVATLEARGAVRKKIIKALDEGLQPIVVVSAMGRKGEPYATDTLLNLIRAENPAVAKHEIDFLISCGENISAAIVAANLQAAGIKALALTGGQAGIITDDKSGAARILKVDTTYLRELIDDGIVPVVCGFQGSTENGRSVTTIGRGGSDTTAAAIGAALKAKAVEIYTDVEGIMTADPRMVKQAEIVECISYGEICQLAYQGAKVIHPRAVEIAMQKNIPLIIKSTFSDAPGTLITNDLGEDTKDTPIIDRIASGVTYLPDISQVRIAMNEEQNTAGMEIFDLLADSNINVDCLNVHPGEIIFTVEENDLDKAVNILHSKGFDKMAVEKSCAKVSVVGAGMRGVPGVMATFVRAFVKAGTPILQTVDSNITISAVIAREHLNKTLAQLHEAFGLSKSVQE